MIFFQGVATSGNLNIKKKIAYVVGVLANWGMLLFINFFKKFLLFIIDCCAVLPIIVVALCLGLDGNSYHNLDPASL